MKRKPQGNGPLAELDFWRERNALLSAIVEQLKIPKVQQMLSIYGFVDSYFEDVQTDLIKFYIEAKDNVRFLSTVERHFKNIAYGLTFKVSIFLL